MSREQTAGLFASRATGGSELDSLVRQHVAHRSNSLRASAAHSLQMYASCPSTKAPTSFLPLPQKEQNGGSGSSVSGGKPSIFRIAFVASSRSFSASRFSISSSVGI